MKVLCTTTSGAGHWGPLLPLARALVDGGHHLVFACPDTAAEALRARGFEVHPFDEVLDRTDEQKELMRRAMTTGDQELAERAIAMGFGLFSPRAALPRLEQTMSQLEPDLVVRDPAEFAGMVLAERDGVPTVAAAAGLQSALAYFCGLVDQHVRRLREEVGVEPRDALLSDELVMTATPPAFDVPGDPSVKVTRYRISAPLVPAPHDEPPLVYATLGTEVMRQPGGATVLHAILEALSQLQVRAVVTTGVDVGELDLPEIPTSVEVRRFADHRDIIPRSRAVVTHGGAGTVQDALLMGRPMVVLPQFADQFLNAERVADVGVGVARAGGDQTTYRIVGALEEVLTGRFDTAVRRIATEAAGMPSLASALEQLQVLAGRH